MSRLRAGLLASLAVLVLSALVPAIGSAAQSCPSAQKVCLTVGEPPALGVYTFRQGKSDPGQGHAGRLSVSKTRGTSSAVGDVRLWLGQEEGCSLSGQLATVAGPFPLVKKTKYVPLGSGKVERSLSWRLPHHAVRVTVGGKTYPGNLSASFLSPAAGSGALPSVEGHLTLTLQEGTVCGGYFFGTHGGTS
jgi:hypothetical protein